jgi:hypothetical protein
LGFGKTEIFLRKGLDKRIASAAADLPVGHAQEMAGWKYKPSAPHNRRRRTGREGSNSIPLSLTI